MIDSYNFEIFLIDNTKITDEKNIVDNSNLLQIKKEFINKYNIIKDSENRRYVLHMLALSNFNTNMYHMFKLKQFKIKIDTYKNDKELVMSNIFVILDIEFEKEYMNRYKCNIILINDQSYPLLTSKTISNALLQYNNGFSSTGNAFLTFNNISDIYKKIFGENFMVNMNDNGRNNYIYRSIRIPENISDIEILDYMVYNFNPYELKPYIILDDFYIDKDISKHYIMQVTNLHNIKTLKKKNILDIKHNSKTKYLNTEELIDRNHLNNELNSTLVLNNKLEDKLYKIQPKDKIKNKEIIPKVFHYDINEDDSLFLKRLKLKKDLVNYNSSILTYEFINYNIEDIQFNYTYNLIKDNIWDCIPISINHEFVLNNNIFNLKSTIKFAQIPDNLI